MSINIFTGLKPLGYTAVLGDSRPAQIFSDSFFLRTSNQAFFNWGNARSNHRLNIVAGLGVSGDRSDQMLARVATAVASGAGHLFIHIGVNDIAQANAGYTTVNTVGPNQGVAVTLSNVAAICAANIQYAIQRFIGAGGRVVTLVLEPGAENFNASQIGATIDLNQRSKETAETYQGVFLFDLWKELHDPTLSSTTTIRFKAGYCQEASGSGVHLGQLGGYKIGIPFSTYINAIFPPVPYLVADVNEIPSISLRNQQTNPLFITATGGTLNTGITGTIPLGWNVARSGGSGTQTATITTGTPADGSPGLETIITPTFAGAGDGFRFWQDATYSNVSVGDIIQGTARAQVDAGGTALAAVNLDMQQNDGTITNLIGDFAPLNNVAIGVDGFTIDMKTPKFTITNKAGGYLTMNFNIFGSAAGAGPAVRIRQMQIKKRFS